MILNIIIAIIMIGLIVLIHEFGHFIVAKANGVAVVEFSIGFGPKLFGIKKGDTEYCLKLIPFGGACIMLGDDMLTQSDDGSEDENGEDEDSDDLPAKERREELLKNYDIRFSLGILLIILIIGVNLLLNYVKKKVMKNEK